MERFSVILIRMPNWLGDSVMAMPALTHLTLTLPQAKIVLAGREPFRRLFLDQPGVAGFVPAPASGFGQLVRGMMQAKQNARKAGIPAIDMGLLFTNSLSTAAWLWSTGAKARVGFDADARRLLLTHPIPRGRAENSCHFIRYYLHLAACAAAVARGEALPVLPEDSAEAPVPSVRVGDGPRRAAGEILKSHGIAGPYAVIAPASAYGAVKDWPPDHYRALTARLNSDMNLPVVVTGGAAQSTVCDAIAKGRKAAVNLAGKTGMDDFAGLLAGAELFVGGDSGGAHLAGALGRPTVVIFGITNPSRTRPSGPRVRCVGKGEDRDVRLSTASAREKAREALAAVTPDDVMAAIDEATHGEA